MIGTWTAPLVNAKHIEEQIVSFDKERNVRILIIPALFDEANKLRRFTCEVMRHLDTAGIDTFLPDLPGMNESLAPLPDQTIAGWHQAIRAATEELAATHILAMRAGSLLAGIDLPGWMYSPTTGAKLLKTLIRSRMIGSKEAGRPETSQEIAQKGRHSGVSLAGWAIGPEMFSELEQANVPADPDIKEIGIADIEGKALWLRAEPDDDENQSSALAKAILADLEAEG